MSSADGPQAFPGEEMLRMLGGLSPRDQPGRCPHARRCLLPKINVRSFDPGDLEVIKRITVEAFSGVSIDEAAELVFGTINGHDWKWRKARHIDADVAREVDGILVAESD